MSIAVFRSLLNHTVALYRLAVISDGQGGWTESHTAIASADGRIRPATSSEIEAAQNEERRISHVLYVEADTNIARGDVAVVDGLTVDVEAIREPSKAGEHYECDCLERQRDLVVAGGV